MNRLCTSEEDIFFDSGFTSLTDWMDLDSPVPLGTEDDIITDRDYVVG